MTYEKDNTNNGSRDFSSERTWSSLIKSKNGESTALFTGFMLLIPLEYIINKN